MYVLSNKCMVFLPTAPFSFSLQPLLMFSHSTSQSRTTEGEEEKLGVIISDHRQRSCLPCSYHIPEHRIGVESIFD